MNWWIYAGVVCFGAIALLIEARRNYRESLLQTPFQRHPILKNARVSDLCSDRDGFVGYLVYSLLYIVSYAVILSSAELYELVRNVNIAKLEVGATSNFDPFGNDVLNLENTSYAKPIFVSAFLIAIMSVGVMKPIESTVRSAAHRIAGIPRGVYRVIDALQTQEAVQTYRPQETGRLAAHFRQELKKVPAGELPTDLAGRREEIDAALSVIDALSLAVTPNRRAQHFPAATLDKLVAMSHELDGQLADLREALNEFEPTHREKLIKLHAQALLVAENTKAVFAVHYIRNNQSVKNLARGSRLAQLVKVIDRNYVPEKNAFAMAAALSTFFSFWIIFTIYASWYEGLTSLLPQQIAADQIEEIITAHNASLPFGGAEDGQGTSAEGAAGEIDPQTCLTTPLGELGDTCRGFVEAGVKDYHWDIRQGLLAQSFWDTLQMASIMLVSAFAAIFGRDVRLEQESWKPRWDMHRMPFLRLSGLSLIPSLLALVGAMCTQLLELFVDSGGRLTQSQLVNHVNDSIAFYVLVMLAAFSMSFVVLVILDKHDDYSRAKTVIGLGVPGIAVVSSLLYATIFFSYTFEDYRPFENFPLISYKNRDWLILSVLPALFLLIFACLIELTEDDEAVAQKRDAGVGTGDAPGDPRFDTFRQKARTFRLDPAKLPAKDPMVVEVADASAGVAGAKDASGGAGGATGPSKKSGGT